MLIDEAGMGIVGALVVDGDVVVDVAVDGDDASRHGLFAGRLFQRCNVLEDVLYLHGLFFLLHCETL
jgi:hypothetical protein